MTDCRFIWRWLPLFPSAKAHATVEIHELPGLSGFLPWAVPEAAPRTVAALFVDQDAAENQGVPSDVVMLTGPPDPSTTTPKNGENVRALERQRLGQHRGLDRSRHLDEPTAAHGDGLAR